MIEHVINAFCAYPSYRGKGGHQIERKVEEEQGNHELKLIKVSMMVLGGEINTVNAITYQCLKCSPGEKRNSLAYFSILT